ncbi:MFS transporter [Pseudarthrobacter sp. NPDC058329]|uniref:MFS transporter n=1 Tax=Pseudarthrobacter sp. NPDC058329 TaxID=3346448 RepID=UPI0036DB4DF4
MMTKNDTRSGELNVEAETSPTQRGQDRHRPFDALRVHNFRIYVAANLAGTTATWVQRIAQDWLVLELTGSAFAVGITVALQFFPMLVFGLYGGVLADRFDKRRLLILAQSAQMVLSAALGLLVLFDLLMPIHIYVAACMLGFATVIDMPVRLAFIGEIVGKQHMANALTLNSATVQVGALLGPAVGSALLASVGGGPAFLCNALACLLAVAGILSMRTRELNPTPPSAHGSGQLLEALRFALGRPDMLLPLVLVVVAALFAVNTAIVYSAMAATVYDVGAGGYGLFQSLTAAGALGGAYLAMHRRTLRLRTVVFSALLYGAALLLAGMLPWYGAFAASLVLVGIGNILFITATNALLQSLAPPAFRGRIVSIFILALLGSQTIGGPLVGGMTELLGAAATLVVMGAVMLISATVTALLIAVRGNFGVRFSRSGMTVVAPGE